MTKRIVRCNSCRRRYDVGQRQVGSQFRCKCGVEVTIRLEQEHDAAVVRCSGCGASREGESKSCSYCGSDFTLHECDLNTVCANCLTRVSSRGRYCHHCGSPTSAHSDLSEPHDLGCPVCGPERMLHSRSLPGLEINVLECQVCAGLWLDIGTLHDLLQDESRRPGGHVVTHRPTTSTTINEVVYRRCVRCNEMMVRRNFGRSSGVIVDICGMHGIWFDHEELSHLLAWVRAGGLSAAQHDASRLLGSPDRVRRKFASDDKQIPAQLERKALLDLQAAERIGQLQAGRSETVDSADLAQLAVYGALKLAQIWLGRG